MNSQTTEIMPGAIVESYNSAMGQYDLSLFKGVGPQWFAQQVLPSLVADSEKLGISETLILGGWPEFYWRTKAGYDDWFDDLDTMYAIRPEYADYLRNVGVSEEGILLLPIEINPDNQDKIYEARTDLKDWTQAALFVAAAGLSLPLQKASVEATVAAYLTTLDGVYEMEAQYLDAAFQQIVWSHGQRVTLAQTFKKFLDIKETE
jgi:hypothetical protein